MQQVKAPTAPVSPSGAVFGHSLSDKRLTVMPGTPKRRHGGAWGFIRGDILYPAIITTISFLSRIFSRNKDELR